MVTTGSTAPQNLGIKEKERISALGIDKMICSETTEDRTTLGAYKHHAREPRNNIKFEYTISRGEKEIMRTLRNMIDFLKGKTDNIIEDIKRMPKINPRGVN